MSILVYDGLRELIKREFIDRNMATTDATVDSATNLIRTVMEDYRGKALQLVGTTLPSTGVPGTIYLQSKSEPNEKNRFIAYAYEGGKFVQVGSSFFPEDFAPDSELNINSQVTVENRVLKSAIDDKFNISGVISNVIPTEPNSVHAKDTPTSAAIQAELATKLGYEDGSPITQEQLWQIFRPELTRPVYPHIKVVFNIGSEDNHNGIYRIANKPIISNLAYKSDAPFSFNLNGSAYGNGGHQYFTRKFVEKLSNREIRIQLHIYVGDLYGAGGVNFEQLFDGENCHPDAYGIYSGYWRHFDILFEFTFQDPVMIGSLPGMYINLKAKNSTSNLRITTELSDTGEANTYTTIQNNVRYNTHYTDGIPFYGFDKRS